MGAKNLTSIGMEWGYADSEQDPDYRWKGKLETEKIDKICTHSIDKDTKSANRIQC